MQSPKAMSAMGADTKSMSIVSEQNRASAMFSQKRRSLKSSWELASESASAKKSHFWECISSLHIGWIDSSVYFPFSWTFFTTIEHFS
jgi:hypothetical protein